MVCIHAQRAGVAPAKSGRKIFHPIKIDRAARLCGFAKTLLGTSMSKGDYSIKVAITACARNLLATLNAMLRTGQHYKKQAP